MVFKIEIERYFEGTSLGPPLCIAVTLASFNFCGKRFEVILLFIKKVNDGDIISALSFKNLLKHDF